MSMEWSGWINRIKGTMLPRRLPPGEMIDIDVAERRARQLLMDLAAEHGPGTHGGRAHHVHRRACYSAQPYAGPSVLIAADETANKVYWDRMLPNQVSYLALAAPHYDLHNEPWLGRWLAVLTDAVHKRSRSAPHAIERVSPEPARRKVV